MKINHVALWTDSLEVIRDFYVRHFGAQCSALYRNEKTGFSSYFLHFEGETNLEIMNMTSIPANANDKAAQYRGLIHIAFSVGSKEAVDFKSEELTKEGYTLLSGPRWTGDGYYESCFFDPDGNRIEITI